MAITYKWVIPSLDTYSTHTDKQGNTETDVIAVIHWKLIATDDVNKVSAKRIGTVKANIDDLSGFTAFNDVTKAQAVAWVESWLNQYPDYDVATIKTLLDTHILDTVNKKIERNKKQT
jgi:hypothetical protein